VKNPGQRHSFCAKKFNKKKKERKEAVYREQNEAAPELNKI